MRKFNTIKKSRKKSKDIDEKIEYLNNECQKTGLNEITMSTSGIYSVMGSEPNPEHEAFRNASVNGLPLGFSGGTFQIDAPLIDGAAYSPPHPITGQRIAAATWKGISIGFTSPLLPGQQKNAQSRIMGDVLWYWNPNSGFNGNWRYLEKVSGQYCVWIDNAFGSMSAVPFFSVNSNLPDSLKNDLLGAGVMGFTDPEKFGPPTNPVLFQNDLDDPSHIPINIDAMSPQAYDTILDKALSDKVNRIARTGRYPNASEQKFLQDYLNNISDPARQQSERMRIFKLNGVWFPLASAGSAGEPVSDTDMNPGLGAQDGDLIAMFGGKPTPPTKKSDFKGLKRNAATTAATMSVNGMGMSPAAFEKKYGISPQDFLNLPENKTSDKKYLEEGVKLGHFEPEVLNVDINDIRKGIMPEFPKDPPPEMIGGYSAKSRLVRKDPELPPFIKVTRKDLAKNHLLTDKEITKFMNDITLINEYIKKNPAELIYVMTRYPKDDPRLAQLNFKMDQMKAASDEYVETHFPENVSLFNKLQNKIRQNIEMTDPKNFTGHAEAPKFIKTDISEQEKRRKTIIRHFKKKK